MEYILSNKQFTDSKQFGKLYYRGSPEITNNRLSILEGETYPEDSSSDIINNYVKGGYNYIVYNTESDELIIKNDKFGMLPLYVYTSKDQLFISNNLWLIITNLASSDILIDEVLFKSYLYLLKIPKEGGTFFKNVKQLNAATLFKIDIKSNKVNDDKYWELEHSNEKIKNIDDAIEILDNDIAQLFKTLKNKFPSSKFGFGNSGGFDSRLIPAYAKQFDLPLKGFIIGDKKPRKLFYSTSHKSAMQIANYYKFEHHNVSYKSSNLLDRLLLDIRNSPIGPNQIFKNPFESIPEFEYLICGGNGFTISNENNKWQEFSSITDEQKKIDFLFQYNSKGVYSTTREKINQLLFKSDLNTKNNIFDSFITSDDKDIYRDYISQFYSKNKHKSNISIIRSFHQSFFNKQSPSGGYESLNRTKKTIYMYYPFAFDNTLRWENDFFFNRIVLQKLILKKDKYLASIPNQEFEYINKPQNQKIRLIRFLIRKRGLDYLKWFKDSQVQHFSRNILQRENPIFEEIVSKNKLKAKDILTLHPGISLDFVKAKAILDIIYYKEFNFINDKRFLIQ
ncbi:hypothetical protein ACFLSE_08680 [Bacteroidota bacterium]